MCIRDRQAAERGPHLHPEADARLHHRRAGGDEFISGAHHLRAARISQQNLQPAPAGSAVEGNLRKGRRHVLPWQSHDILSPAK